MKLKYRTTASLLILWALLMAQPKLSSAMEDGIVAVVNDELITLKDLKDYIKQTFVTLSAQGFPQEQLEKYMLDMELNGIQKLVEERVILSHANAIGLEVRAELIEDRVAEIRAKYPDEQTFLSALQGSGITLGDLKTQITNQLKIQYAVDYEVQSKIYVSPKEVTQFYEDNITKFQTKETAEVDSIFIAFKDNKKETRQKIKEAQEQILSGKWFLAVAKEYSDTPSIGKLERGQLLASVENTIFSLKEGEVSDIVEVTNGVYLFKMNKIIPKTTAALSDVKGEITKQLQNKKFQDRFKTWINELKRDAYIEIKN